jgi:hypothetical protein
VKQEANMSFSRVIGLLLLVALLVVVLISIGLMLVQWVRSENDTPAPKKANIIQYEAYRSESGLVLANAAALETVLAVNVAYSPVETNSSRAAFVSAQRILELG